MDDRELFDVVVIGGGPAGENIAGRCVECGATIAVVEAERLGGECSYWACIPSKALLRPGEARAEIRRVPGAARAVSGAVDVAAVFSRRDELAAHWDDDGQVEWLESAGGVLVRGRGRLTGERKVDVDLAGDGGVRRLEARRAVVLATGSTPVVPAVEGLRDVRAWGSRDATSASTVPQRLIVLGGGVVGVEMAQAWKRLGAHEVTLIARGERLIEHLEPFAGDELRAAFEAERIEVLLNAEAVHATRQSADAPVELELRDGRTMVGDELLVAVGRRPNMQGLGLETVGISVDRPVEVDDQLRVTAVEGGWLYAVGDVNGRSPLTHMGKYQARVAADVILEGASIEAWADHRAVPSVIFTDPQVASVGLTEAAARACEIDVRSVRYGTGDVAGASVRGRGITGTSQLVIDQHRDVVVGATFTGPGVAEMLHAATIAVAGEVPIRTLWHAVPSFPTVSEVWLRLLEEYGR